MTIRALLAFKNDPHRDLFVFNMRLVGYLHTIDDDNSVFLSRSGS